MNEEYYKVQGEPVGFTFQAKMDLLLAEEKLLAYVHAKMIFNKEIDDNIKQSQEVIKHLEQKLKEDEETYKRVKYNWLYKKRNP